MNKTTENQQINLSSGITLFVNKKTLKYVFLSDNVILENIIR